MSFKNLEQTGTFNIQCACTAKVTVLVLCVCVSVCLSFSLSTTIFTLQATISKASVLQVLEKMAIFFITIVFELKKLAVLVTRLCGPTHQLSVHRDTVETA